MINFSSAALGDNFDQLIVLDLRTGRLTAGADLGEQGLNPTDVRDAALKRNGSFAWIQDTRRGSPQGALERAVNVCPIRLCRSQPEGPQPRVVAQGLTIDPHSLSRRGPRLAWIQDGRRRCVEL
jgi:hypothetical protein